MTLKTLLRSDKIEEYAFVVVLQIGQIVRKVSEVVADSDLQILADAPINRRERTATALIHFREIEGSHLSHALPVLQESSVQSQYPELCGAIEELLHRTIKADLAQAAGILAADRPVRREVVGQIQRRHMALLNKLGRRALRCHLVRSRDVIKVRIFGQRAQPVMLHRSIRIADDGFCVTAAIEFTERTITNGVIELADHAPVRRQLNFEVVTEQPQGSFGMRQIERLCVVPTILPRARELERV